MRGLVVPVMLAAGVLAAPGVWANEIQGNYAWQFRTPNERAVAAGMVDLIERKRAGAYGPATLTSNNFFGPSIACDIVATAAGNTGTASVSGASSAPTLQNQPVVSAATTGSTSSGLLVGPTPGGTQSSSSAQTNDASTLNAGVSGTTSTLSPGTIDASGGILNQTTSSRQTNTRSPQTATVANSTACNFVGR